MGAKWRGRPGDDAGSRRKHASSLSFGPFMLDAGAGSGVSHTFGWRASEFVHAGDPKEVEEESAYDKGCWDDAGPERDVGGGLAHGVKMVSQSDRVDEKPCDDEDGDECDFYDAKYGSGAFS